MHASDTGAAQAITQAAVAAANQLKAGTDGMGGEAEGEEAGETLPDPDGVITHPNQCGQGKSIPPGDTAAPVAPASRHPRRLLRFRPPRRGHADVAWAAGGQHVELSKEEGSGWVLSATADKTHISRARKEPDWARFDEANRKEVQQLRDNHIWSLDDLPSGKTISVTQMLCERERGATVDVER